MADVVGFQSQYLGMQGSQDPVTLNDGQYSLAVNIENRGGLVRTRSLKFMDLGVAEPAVETGRFRGCVVYRQADADRVIGVFGKQIVGVNLETGLVTIYGTSFPLDAGGPCYFLQAEDFLIVQDGVNPPIIINPTGTDPLASRRVKRVIFGDAVNEVPTGTTMAYGQGRIFVTLCGDYQGTTYSGERYFAAGDILLPKNPATVLIFAETDYLSGGGAFGLPEDLGIVKAMGFMRNAQTGSGIGELIVFGERGVSSFNVALARSSWQSTPISKVLFGGIACWSPRSIINVTSDLYFRGTDGLRSLAFTYQEATSGSIALNGLSGELQSYIDRDDESTLPYVSAVWTQNRFLMPVVPQMDGSILTHLALASMDTSVLMAMASTQRPCWDGLWTGVPIMQVVKGYVGGVETTLFYGRRGRKNILGKLTEATTDFGATSVVSRHYTKGFNVAAQGVMRRLTAVDISLETEAGPGSYVLKVYYRQVGYPYWSAMQEAAFDVPGGSVDVLFPQIRFIPGPKEFNRSTGMATDAGRSFQFCVEATRDIRIRSLEAFFDRTEVFPMRACAVEVNGPTVPGTASGQVIDELDYEA